VVYCEEFYIPPRGAQPYFLCCRVFVNSLSRLCQMPMY